MKLTKTDRAVMIWFISCVTCAPSYRHHPFTLWITVHPGRRPSLWVAVRNTCPSNRHQSCRLCPWGCGHVGGQVQSCCWTAAIKYGHTHEWYTCSTVYYSQHKSKSQRQRQKERQRERINKGGKKMSRTAGLSVIQSWRKQANVDWLIPVVCFLFIQTIFLQILVLEHTDIYSVELLRLCRHTEPAEFNFISEQWPITKQHWTMQWYKGDCEKVKGSCHSTRYVWGGQSCGSSCWCAASGLVCTGEEDSAPHG